MRAQQSASFALSDLQLLAEDFAAAHLDDYVAALRISDAGVRRKEVNDALWGTIGLTPLEVAILDSPLLQRLRYIRQLGVVHWVYPGAGHTRFEHTLGVLHQVQRLIQALNALGTQKGHQQLIDPGKVQLLRLCALLHDVGHAAFSHVSEKAFETLRGLGSLSSEFSRVHRIEDRRLSEIFAYLIARSRSMKELLGVLLDKHNGIQLSSNRLDNLDAVVDGVARAIVGQKIDDRLPLLHEIISGPFDADKLDYYVRDARLAGTPSVLDISRLVQKISIRELDARDLPADIARNVDKIDGPYCLFGIKWSGVAMLDELHLARVLLYAKIYRHSKVVALEQMLGAALVTLGKIVSAGEILKLAYTYDDGGFLALNSEGLRIALGLEPSDVTPDIRARLECAAEIIKDIRARRLLVKAFEVQRRYPADQIEQDQTQKNALTDFRERIEHPDKREEFRQALIEEVEKILKVVDPKNVPTRVVLEATILIHSLGPIPGSAQIARAYLLPSTGRPVQFREYTVNRAAWADAYMSDQPIGFVFSPASTADAVYVAIEKLSRETHGLCLPKAAMEASKRQPGRIEGLKRVLHQAGYYRSAPFDIRPMPGRLTRADVEKSVAEFSERLAKYSDPNLPNEDGYSSVPKERVINWLRQFDTDDDVDCALRLLSKFRFIGRNEAVKSLTTFIDKNPAFRGAVVVPFGNARDSGSVQAYFAADVIGSHIQACCTVDEAVKKFRNSPLIFVDDFIGSGGQGQDMLAAAFGLKELRKDLGEQREMFDDDIRLHLQRAKLGFVFSAAWGEGISTIQAVAKQLKFDASFFALLSDKDIPFAFDGCLAGLDEDVVAAFKMKCERVGRGIIHTLNEADPRVATKMDERMLGYGNRAMLLASPFNVPTQTMTLFWGNGRVEGVHWSALLTRRKKK